MSDITLSIEGSQLGEHGILTLNRETGTSFTLQMEVFKKLDSGEIETSYSSIDLNPAELPHVLHMLQAMANLIQHHIAYTDET